MDYICGKTTFPIDYAFLFMRIHTQIHKFGDLAETYYTEAAAAKE